MLTLRHQGPRDYDVREDGQSVGRIRYAKERHPGIWLWHIQVHIPGEAKAGSSKDLPGAKAEFKSAWDDLKARVAPERLAQAYAAMNIRKCD